MTIALDRGPQDVGDLLRQLNDLRIQINALAGNVAEYDDGTFSGLTVKDNQGNDIAFITSDGTLTDFSLADPADPTNLTAFDITANYGILQTSIKPLVVAYGSFTFADLETAIPSPSLGMTVVISDSNTATWGATIAGGGTDEVLAFYNGTNWTVAGK